MSWRAVQLGKELCDQDRLILDLFDGADVKYIGLDEEFKTVLPLNEFSTNLILIINHRVWYSNIIKLVSEHLTQYTDKFYIGINRYCIKGNDTTEKFTTSNHHGQDIVSALSSLVGRSGFAVTKSGHYDKDRGRHFNFVQPLTWIYGHRVEANTSN